MSKQKKNGFTLVELLAVIVILAVILVIAVPSIMSTTTESRKGALASSAKLIASSAETAYISNQTLGIEKTIECSDVSNYTEEDYASCKIKFVDGKAKVKLVGQGKFEGMAVCSGTKEEADVVEECPPTAVEKIENLFKTAANANGLFKDDTADQNIRYTGASPKNYIKFNNEDWRIIGIFSMTTSGGKQEKLLKIVKDTPLSTIMSWDSSASGVNYGNGVNEWSQADLMTMLNTYYIGTSTKCKYCNSKGQGTCPNDCSSSVTPIGSTYIGMIEEVLWNTGAIASADSLERSLAYSQERGNITGKICTGGDFCDDTVTRTITWTGKVGLIYPSDYGYASTEGTDILGTTIKTSNWLHVGSAYWALSPCAILDRSTNSWFGVSTGYTNKFVWANSVVSVRPALYLKSDVYIVSGEGTQTSPYQISMS